MADFGIGEAAAIASIAGTGIAAAGALNSAAAQSANARYQAEVAKNNQIVANQNAQYASQAGAAAVTRAQLKQRDELGAIGARLAASGIDPNTGSAAAVKNSASELTELDTETTAQDAALRVYGFRTNATNFGAQSTLQTQEAEQAGIAGPLSAGATFLSGFGGLAAKWRPWQTSALPDPGSGEGGNPGPGTGGLY